METNVYMPYIKWWFNVIAIHPKAVSINTAKHTLFHIWADTNSLFLFARNSRLNRLGTFLSKIDRRYFIIKLSFFQ